MSDHTDKSETAFSSCCILVLVGLPASGKTTFAKKLEEHYSGSSFRGGSTSVLHVCYDELVPLDKQAQLASEAQRAEKEAEWKDLRGRIVRAVEKIMVTAEEGIHDDDLEKRLSDLCLRRAEKAKAVGDRLLVVIDDNNYYRSMRYDYYQLARRIECGFCQLHLLSTEVSAQEANAAREERIRVPPEVIARMNQKMEAPDPLNNAWEQFSFSLVNGSGVDESVLAMCESVVELAFGNPAKSAPQVDPVERDRSRRACTASVVHQADKLLRKMVGTRIRTDTSGREQKDVASELYAAKTELLEDMRTGFAKLPAEVVNAVERRDKDAVEKLAVAVEGLFRDKVETVNQ